MLARGTPLRDVAGQFGISKSAVDRHAAAHLAADLVAGVREERADAARGTLDRLRDLAAETRRVLEMPKQKAVIKLKAIQRLERQLELEARLLGELQASAAPIIAVQLAAAPEWMDLRGRIVAALRPYPEARAAVLAVVEVES